MPFQVRKLELSDVERLTDIQYAAFAGDPWGQIMFPKIPPMSARGPTIRRYRNLIENDLTVELMKVVDTDTGEMVSFARWEMYYHERPESEYRAEAQPKREWDEGTNTEATDALIAAVQVADEKLIGGRPHCHLGLLDTHPDHHRRGAGSMLVKWGTDIADDKGLPCYLEASANGYGLYMKHGFELLGENIDLDMSKFGGQGMYQFKCMVRPAKGA